MITTGKIFHFFHFSVWFTSPYWSPGLPRDLRRESSPAGDYNPTTIKMLQQSVTTRLPKPGRPATLSPSRFRSELAPSEIQCHSSPGTTNENCASIVQERKAGSSHHVHAPFIGQHCTCDEFSLLEASMISSLDTLWSPRGGCSIDISCRSVDANTPDDASDSSIESPTVSPIQDSSVAFTNKNQLSNEGVIPVELLARCTDYPIDVISNPVTASKTISIRFDDLDVSMVPNNLNRRSPKGESDFKAEVPQKKPKFR